jgi:hypothetical protein
MGVVEFPEFNKAVALAKVSGRRGYVFPLSAIIPNTFDSLYSTRILGSAGKYGYWFLEGDDSLFKELMKDLKNYYAWNRRMFITDDIQKAIIHKERVDGTI